MLRIKRKSTTRKAYTTAKGKKVASTKVKGSSYLAEDRGAKGRGKKVLPPLKEGTLGGKGFYSLAAPVRHVEYEKKCKKYGSKIVLGKIMALRVFNKRTNPELYRKLVADYNWVLKNC